jgi:hypothetical protein
MLVGLTLAIAASPARAEWIPVSVGTNGSVFSMDASRIMKVGNRVQAWVKVDHSKNAAVKYRSEMQLWSFICSTRKSRLLQYTEYDSYGKVVGSNSVDDSEYTEIGYSHVTPDSVGETQLNVGCSKE